MRSPVFFVVNAPLAGFTTSVTVTPSGMSTSTAVAATFASLCTRTSYFCVAPLFDCVGETMTWADSAAAAATAITAAIESLLCIISSLITGLLTRARTGNRGRPQSNRKNRILDASWNMRLFGGLATPSCFRIGPFSLPSSSEMPIPISVEVHEAIRRRVGHISEARRCSFRRSDASAEKIESAVEEMVASRDLVPGRLKESALRRNGLHGHRLESQRTN